MCQRCFVLFSLALASLAASFPQYPVKPARDYPTAEEKSGLVVAAVPVEDQKDQHTYFGIDLRSKGYIPVLLVIENQTSNESYFLRKESLMYSPAGRSGSTLPNPANPSRADKAVAVAGAVPTIYTFMATLAASRSKELRQHLLGTELQSATLSPGGSAHGFIFVPGTHGGHSSRQKIKLTVPFTRSGTNEEVTINSTI
jgi:hypothetical protein